MNEQHIDSGKDYVVMDENVFRKVEYNGDIQEIPVIENLLKQINSDIPVIEEEIKKAEKEANSYKKYIKLPLLIGTITFVTSILLMTIFTDDYLRLYPYEEVSDIFSTGLSASFVTLFAGVGLSINLTFSRNNILDKINGLNSELEFLNNEKIRLTEKHESLISQETKAQDNISINRNQDEVQKVMYIEAFKELKVNLELYNLIGVHQEKYITLYKEGTLRSTLKNYYSTDFIDLIERKIAELVNNQNKPKVIEKK